MLLLGLFEIPTGLLVILVIVAIFYFYTERKHSIFRRYGIPGPKPKPFIGGFPALIKKGVVMTEYEESMKYGKCLGFFLGNLPTIWVTDTEIIKEIFIKRFTSFPNRSQSAYVSSFWEKTILMTSEYDHWKFLRMTMTPTFSSGKLKKMDSIILPCIDNMIKFMHNKSQTFKDGFNLVPIFRGLALNTICNTAMGVNVDCLTNPNNEFMKQVESILDFSMEKNPLLLLLFLIPDVKKVCKLFDIDYNNTKAINYVKDSLKTIINERKMENTDSKVDLLQLMINSHKEAEQSSQDSTKSHQQRGMTDDEVIANAIIFLFAGTDTTSTVLIFASFFFATKPEWQEKLRCEIDEKIGKADPNYENVHDLECLEMFVSEVMRLYPPVTRVNRHTYAEETLNGFKFPKDISVTVPLYALHRVEEYWPDPLKFDPERFSYENKPKIIPYSYMPFGVGPRNCVGMRFAQMEVKMAIVRLLQNFTFKPSLNLQTPIKLQKNVFCRPEGGMPLVLEKREN